MISGPPLPSDAKLLAQFERTKLELDQLREMVEADGLSGRIHEDYFDDQRLSKSRLQQYRQLMKTVGVDRLACTGRCQHIEFNVAGTGWHDIGNYKGFYYSPGEQANRAPSLDKDCWSETGKERYCTAARRIEGNWWLLRYQYR